MVRSVLSVALVGWLVVTPALGAESVVGKWKTVDDKTGKELSEVDVYEQGGKVFGKITGLTEPNDAAGKPKVCTRCTGPTRTSPSSGS